MHVCCAELRLPLLLAILVTSQSTASVQSLYETCLLPSSISPLQVDVCKLMPTFPRGMSACVRESFLRMDVMDPLLRTRLSQWLAYHLSNYDFMWPWDKWKHVLTAPLHDAQRSFFTGCLDLHLTYGEA